MGNETSFWTIIANPDWITALLLGLGSVLTAVLVRGKAAEPDSKQEQGNVTANHQEIFRPQTEAEMRSAEALEKIAEAVSRIERTADVYARSRNRE